MAISPALSAGKSDPSESPIHPKSVWHPQTDSKAHESASRARMPQHTRTFFNLGRMEQRIGNGVALCPTLRQPTTVSSEKQQFCFGNWHPGQACSWKWIWFPLSCNVLLPASLPTPSSSCPSQRHHCARLAQQQRRDEEEENIFCPWDVLKQVVCTWLQCCIPGAHTNPPKCHHPCHRWQPLSSLTGPPPLTVRERGACS